MATTSSRWPPTISRELIGQQLVVASPRQVAGEMAGDAEFGPPVELDVEVGGGAFGGEAKRVADEVGDLFAVGSGGESEIVTERQRSDQPVEGLGRGGVEQGMGHDVGSEFS